MARLPLFLLLCLGSQNGTGAKAAQRDYYEVLNITPDASPSQVNRAYNILSGVHKGPEASAHHREIHQAWEVLGNPERRSRYDRRSSFFLDAELEERENTQGQPDAPDFGRGLILPSMEAVQEAVDSGTLWVFHVYSDRQTIFGEWMSELHDAFSLGHINIDRSEELSDKLRTIHAVPDPDQDGDDGGLLAPPFLMVCKDNSCRSFPPDTSGMYSLFRSVNRDIMDQALKLVDYWEHIWSLQTAEELRQFCAFHYGSSNRLRVVVFVEDADDRHFELFAAASKLHRVAEFVQFKHSVLEYASGRARLYFKGFSPVRLPAVVFIDPISGFYSSGLLLKNLHTVTERLLQGGRVNSQTFGHVQEFDAESYEWRCGGGGLPCRGVALLATPPRTERERPALAIALDTLSEACESFAGHEETEPNITVACFWFRLGRSREWMQTFLPYQSQPAEPFIIALLCDNMCHIAPNECTDNASALVRWFQDRLRPHKEAHGRRRVGAGRRRADAEADGEGAASFTLYTWPKLPKGLASFDNAYHKWTWTRLWWEVSKANTWFYKRFEAILIRWSTQRKFYGLVLTSFCVLFALWWWLNSDPSAESNLEEQLASLGMQLTVTLRRDPEAGFGFAFTGHVCGGLEITSIAPNGPLQAWNTREREEQRVRIGDRIIWITWLEGGRRKTCGAMTGSEAMAGKLDNPEVVDVVLTLRPGPDAPEFQMLNGMVTLNGLTLKESGRFTFGAEDDGSARPDLELIQLKPGLERWNDARLREGACILQRLEVGDRIMAVGSQTIFGDSPYSHTNVSEQLTVADPMVWFVRWRSETKIICRHFTVEMEREDTEEEPEPWGLDLRRRILEGVLQFFVHAVVESSVVSRCNAVRAGQPDMLQVLPGDHLISVNGSGPGDPLAEELGRVSKMHRIEIEFERWLETEDDEAEQQDMGGVVAPVPPAAATDADRGATAAPDASADAVAGAPTAATSQRSSSDADGWDVDFGVDDSSALHTGSVTADD